MRCSKCPCPLPDDAFPRLRARGDPVCQCCYELYAAIYMNAHFIGAQVEWELQMKKLGRLRFGADYFKEEDGA